MKKYFKKYNEFLNESLSSARKRYLDTNKVTQQEFDYLSEIDPSTTKKYLDKICEWFIDGATRKELMAVISAYDLLITRNLTQRKDINTFESMNDLEVFLEESKNVKSKTEQKRAVTQGTKVILDNERFFIVQPLTKEQVKIFSYGTKWCLHEMFDQYKNYCNFFIIEDKTLTKENPMYKMALSVYKDGVAPHTDGQYELSDAIDNNKNEYYLNANRYFKEVGLDESLFGIDTEKQFERFGLSLANISYEGTKKVYTGDIDLSNKSLILFPKFGIDILKGNLIFSGNGDSRALGREQVPFVNFPEIIEGDFDCSNCYLEGFKYNAVEYVGGTFDCSGNHLQSLIHCPKEVAGDFVCSDNEEAEFTEENVMQYCTVGGNIIL